MKIISQVDRNPAFPNISIGGIKNQKNFCGGILGVIFWIILIVLFIKKSIFVFGKNDVKVQTFIKRDQSQIQINAYNNRFGLIIIQQNPQGNIPIGYKQQNQYGFQVTMVQYFIWYNQTDQKVYNDVKLLPMVACAQDQDFFCIPNDFAYMNMSCQLEKVGPNGCNQSRYYDILIRQCKHDNPDCAQNIQERLFAAFGFQDNSFNVFEPKSQQMFEITNRGFNIGAEFENQNQYVFRIYFSKLLIETDQSISPGIFPFHSTQNIQGWFYPNQDESFIDFFPYSRHRFMTIQLRRSFNTEIYKRSYQSIDTMLAEILGFMGLITWVVSICCADYNQYLMEEHVSHKKSEAQQTNQNIQQNFQTAPQKYNRSFVRYWKNKLKSILNRNKPTYSKQIDLMEMYEKICKLQKLVLDLKGERSRAEIHITNKSLQTKNPIQKEKQKSSQQLKESLLTEKIK